MFDRLFNILRSNLSDKLGNDKNFGIDHQTNAYAAEYDEYIKNKSANSQHQTYQSPNPTIDAQELEALKALELKAGAPFAEIKTAYKTLIKKYHPDKFYNDPSKHKTALELTQKLNKAYDYLEKKHNK